MKREDNLDDIMLHLGQWEPLSLSSDRKNWKQCLCNRKPRLEQMVRVTDGLPGFQLELHNGNLAG